MIHVSRIIFDHGDDRIGSDEAGEVVDVAVRVVAEDAAAEPDRVRRAEVVGENFFVVFARHAGVALLHLAEQAFFGGEDGAASVDVDGAAFEHDAGVVTSGRISSGAGSFAPSGCRFFRRAASWNIWPRR